MPTVSTAAPMFWLPLGAPAFTLDALPYPFQTDSTSTVPAIVSTCAGPGRTLSGLTTNAPRPPSGRSRSRGPTQRSPGRPADARGRPNAPPAISSARSAIVRESEYLGTDVRARGDGHTSLSRTGPASGRVAGCVQSNRKPTTPPIRHSACDRSCSFVGRERHRRAGLRRRPRQRRRFRARAPSSAGPGR